jgi:transcriptional regulator with XRE-family HTH domain
MNDLVNTQMNVVLLNGYSLSHSYGMDIANQLDRAMKSYGNNKGISQADLAALSKVPQPTISRTLKGSSTPETKTLIKLARALNCTLGGYTGTEQMPAVNELQAHYNFPTENEESKILRAFRLASPEVRLVWLGMADGIFERINTPSRLTGNDNPSPG